MKRLQLGSLRDRVTGNSLCDEVTVGQHALHPARVLQPEDERRRTGVGGEHLDDTGRKRYHRVARHPHPTPAHRHTDTERSLTVGCSGTGGELRAD